MKHLPIFLSCFCFCLFLQPAYADADEDFEVQEEGMMFDHARTGLFYQRNLYLDDLTRNDPITHVPYYPLLYNSTNDMKPWDIYVYRLEQDSPSFVVVYIMDDSVNLNSKSEVDLEISVSHLDRLGNRVIANRKRVNNIAVSNGMNRIPLNIHNYKGDYVVVNIADNRPKSAIRTIENAQ